MTILLLALSLFGAEMETINEKWCTKEKFQLIAEHIIETRPQVCVEVGVFSGNSLLAIASALKHNGEGMVYAIDAWSSEVAIRHMGPHDPHRHWWNAINLDLVYDKFVDKLETFDLKPYVVILKMPSEKAVGEIEWIDFLHLDGDYTPTGSKHDVVSYLSKVKPGGYVLMSDILMMSGPVQPKLAAAKALFMNCDYVADVENGNAILFRKR